QEVVIVGYTEPRRSRKYFGSLALAVRDKAKKCWVYAGHVGTGFNEAMLKSLYGKMQSMRTSKKPFDQKVKYENETTWLIPRLVGEVKFTEWTRDGEMRHPAFLVLRPDKKALDVIREPAYWPGSAEPTKFELAINLTRRSLGSSERWRRAEPDEAHSWAIISRHSQEDGACG